MRRLLGLLLLLAGHAAAEAQPPVTVYSPKVCLACIEWTVRLCEHGFKVMLDDSGDMATIKRRYRIGADLEARHTALVGDYVGSVEIRVG
jgi:hypothetical protein